MPVLKPRDGLMIAFFVPVLVMICIFAQRGIFPFGERCFLRTDMYHQYAPFFSVGFYMRYIKIRQLI